MSRFAKLAMAKAKAPSSTSQASPKVFIPKKIVQAVMAKHMSSGGSVSEGDIPEDDMSEMSDEMYAHMDMQEEDSDHQEMMVGDEPEMDQKKRISMLLDKIRMKHMGK